MIQVRLLHYTYKSFFLNHISGLLLAISLAEKDIFKLKLFVLPVTVNLAVFRQLGTSKNVSFFFCIFSATLQRLPAQKSWIRLKNYYISDGKRKDHIGFLLPWLYIISQSKLPICKNIQPIISCICTHSHLQILQAYLFRSWWRFQWDSSKAAYSLPHLNLKLLN